MPALFRKVGGWPAFVFWRQVWATKTVPRPAKVRDSQRSLHLFAETTNAANLPVVYFHPALNSLSG
jgi:hypothetical protein